MQATQLDKQLQKSRDAIRKNNADYALQILSMQVLKAEPDNREAYELYFQAIDAKWRKKKMPKAGGLTKLWGSTTKLISTPEKIIENCLKKFSESPQDPAYLNQLAEALRHKEYWNACEVVCERWTKIDDNNAIAFFWYAQAQEKVDKMPEAVTTIQVARSLDRNNREITEYARDIEARSTLEGKKKSGGKSLETAGWRDALANTADAAKTEKERRGFTNKAEVDELLETYGGWEKADKRALQDLATRYEKVGAYADAVKAWKKLYEQDSTYVDALDKAGELTAKHYNSQIELAQKKQLPKEKIDELRQKRDMFTLAEYTRRVKAHPTDLRLRFMLGSALFDAERYADASKQLQRAAKDPQYAQKAGLMLARSFFEIDQHDVAIMQLDRLLSDSGTLSEENEVEARYWKARSLMAKDQKDEAKKLLMEIYMDNSDFRDIDELLRQLG